MAADTYQDRLARALAELHASDISSLNYDPPMFRIARRLGLQPRPPHYMSFAQVALLLGPFFGVVWAGLMWLAKWQNEGTPPWQIVASAILAGTVFGLLMAGYYRWAGHKARLSNWEEL